MKPIIQVQNVSQRFATPQGEFIALDRVSFDIQAGETLSLIGHSGCGKSTLLNLIAGLTLPSDGVLLCDNRQITGPGPERGVVFQNHSLLPWLTTYENVALAVHQVFRHEMTRSEMRDWVEHNLALVHMSHALDKRPHEISGGMKQRVGIARALAMEPKVLLLDEPFGALDAQTRVIMQQILTNLWQRLGISVLFVTHDIDEAIFLSDRIYVMTARPGTIKAEVTVPLPRPRDAALQLTPEFVQLRADLGALIREESLKAMGGELNEDALKGLAVNLNGASLAEVV